MAEKTCSLCGVPQDIEQFNKHSTTKDRRHAECKTCNKARCKYYRDLIKEQVFAHFGARCACCGETCKIFLTLDHKANDGAEHRRSIGAGRNTASSTDKVWRWLVKTDFAEAERFQVLCYNCNCGKRDNGGVCPHEAKA